MWYWIGKQLRVLLLNQNHKPGMSNNLAHFLSDIAICLSYMNIWYFQNKYSDDDLNDWKVSVYIVLNEDKRNLGQVNHETRLLASSLS